MSDDQRRDHMSILAASQLNNGLDGVSGILWADEGRYLQVLEGPPTSVASALERITRDNRHTDIVILSDSFEDERAFGDWSMAGLPGDRPADAMERLRLLLRTAPEEVRQYFPTFEGE